MKGNPIKYFNDLYDARIKSMQGGGDLDDWVDLGYPGSGKEKRKASKVKVTKTKRRAKDDEWVASEDIKSKNVSRKRAERMKKRGWKEAKRY